MTARVVGCLVLVLGVAGSAAFNAQTVVRRDVQLGAALGPGFSLSVAPSITQLVHMRWVSQKTEWAVEAASVSVAYSAAGIVVDLTAGTLVTTTDDTKVSQPFQNLSLSFANAEMRGIQLTAR